MKHRDLSNYSKKAIVYLDSTQGPEYDSNLANGSIFRINDTTDVTLNNPTNLRDGSYIRFEIATGITDTITFGSLFTIDGVAMTQVTNLNGLYVLEGRYSTVIDKLLMRIV